MIYLSYGMTKSASSFCFQIIQDLLLRYSKINGIRFGNIRDVLPGYQYGAYFSPSDSCTLDFFLEKALVKSNQNMCMAVKVHCNLTEYAKDLIEKKAILANASFRHPADCILSFMDAYKKENAEQKESRFREGKSFESSLNVYIYQGNTFLEWAQVKNIILIYYNDIVTSPELVAKRIKDQIGLDIDETEVLNPYLEDKTKIWEFNKGKLDRRLKETFSYQIQEVEKKCYNLISFIEEYSKKSNYQ